VPSVAHAISLRAPWSLDLDELLEASRIMGTNDYDAISAYRYLMRWAFRAIAAPSGGRVSLFDHLASALDEDESRFFESAKHYLRQYHHVTSTSFECLLPAAEAMPFARDKVLEVTLEEKGHGGFTADSLKALGVREPALLPLGPHVSALMDCLKLAAHVNPLAFSCLFNVFEMPGEQDQDPMAALLARSSKPEAARGLQAHFQLNKDGAHFTSGFELVGEMTAVDEYTVVEAARLTELHFMLLDEVCRDVMARGAH
jgi:hypothetical protein